MKILFVNAIALILIFINNLIASASISIVFSSSTNRFWSVDADHPFIYENISEQLDLIAPISGNDSAPITVSHDGNWYSFRSQRFDAATAGWGALTIVKTDFSTYEVIRNSSGELIHSVGRSQVFNNGNSIVYTKEVSRGKDVFVMHRNRDNWGDEINITSSSPYNYNSFPFISVDESMVLFDASNSSYPSIAIGEVKADGSELTIPITATTIPNGTEAHSGSYDSDMNIIYEGSNDETIWKLVRTTSTPVRIASYVSNDNSPVILPDGRIASLLVPGGHQVKIMNADGTNPYMLTESSSFFSDVFDLGLSSFSTGTSSSSQNLCTGFTLKQNYPNPFNPTTVINYELPSNGYQIAKILIYNSGGQIVKECPCVHPIVDGILLKGSIQFDGSKLNSGIYYYSLVVDGKRNNTKKMILIK